LVCSPGEFALINRKRWELSISAHRPNQRSVLDFDVGTHFFTPSDRVTRKVRLPFGIMLSSITRRIDCALDGTTSSMIGPLSWRASVWTQAETKLTTLLNIQLSGFGSLQIAKWSAATGIGWTPPIPGSALDSSTIETNPSAAGRVS